MANNQQYNCSQCWRKASKRLPPQTCIPTFITSTTRENTHCQIRIKIFYALDLTHTIQRYSMNCIILEGFNLTHCLLTRMQAKILIHCRLMMKMTIMNIMRSKSKSKKRLMILSSSISTRAWLLLDQGIVIRMLTDICCTWRKIMQKI